MMTCNELVWRAKDITQLNRNGNDWWNNLHFCEFIQSWIGRYQRVHPHNDFERMIYLWVTVNGWASQYVPDLTKNHNDAYLVHCLSKDSVLNDRFNTLIQSNPNFKNDVDELLGYAPVFQVLWLHNKNLRPWDWQETRTDYIKYVFDHNPFISIENNGQTQRYPAFAPQCAEKHLEKNEPIPKDWSHTLSVIYQIRCNLFHGGKSFVNRNDTIFVSLAHRILWKVWKEELPFDLVRPRTHLPEHHLLGPRHPSGHESTSEKMVLPWERVLIRSGFKINKTEEGLISLSEEISSNRQYLEKLLQDGNFGSLQGLVFQPRQESIDQDEWLQCIARNHGGAEAGDPTELPIMDPHMGGLIRWMNEVGVETLYSYEGHPSRGNPTFFIAACDSINAEIGAKLLNLKFPFFSSNGSYIVLIPRNGLPHYKMRLLDLAEWLYENHDWLKITVAGLRQNMSVAKVDEEEDEED